MPIHRKTPEILTRVLLFRRDCHLEQDEQDERQDRYYQDTHNPWLEGEEEQEGKIMRRTLNKAEGHVKPRRFESGTMSSSGRNG